MAKYLITIIILILIAGCIFKDENKKGTLNFSITWPEKSIKTKAIPSTCEKIIISLYKYGEESTIKPLLKMIDSSYKGYAERCEKYADLFFSADQNARRYIQVYQNLLS